jgi:hypothetical protein
VDLKAATVPPAGEQSEIGLIWVWSSAFAEGPDRSCKTASD